LEQLFFVVVYKRKRKVFGTAQRCQAFLKNENENEMKNRRKTKCTLFYKQRLVSIPDLFAFFATRLYS